MSPLPKAARATRKVYVLVGNLAGTVRIPSMPDWIVVRLYDDRSTTARALLPRLATSSNPLPSDPTTLTDDLLPVADTILIASPLGNSSPLLGDLVIDVSSLPVGTTRMS